MSCFRVRDTCPEILPIKKIPGAYIIKLRLEPLGAIKLQKLQYLFLFSY